MKNQLRILIILSASLLMFLTSSLIFRREVIYFMRVNETKREITRERAADLNQSKYAIDLRVVKKPNFFIGAITGVSIMLALSIYAYKTNKSE